MGYDKQGFTEFYSGSPDACASYRSYLNKVDRALGGLDEYLATHSAADLLTWVEESQDVLQPSPRSTKSAVKKYISFRTDRTSEVGSADEIVALEEIEQKLFRAECELQFALRAQIAALEPGLSIVDGGTERSVATGRIDVLAQEPGGRLVVIELKAGACPKGALEQAMGYAADIDAEKPELAPCRIIVIAGSFSDRQRAAAKRSVGLELRTYAYSLSFLPAR